MMFE